MCVDRVGDRREGRGEEKGQLGGKGKNKEMVTRLRRGETKKKSKSGEKTEEKSKELQTRGGGQEEGRQVRVERSKMK